MDNPALSQRVTRPLATKLWMQHGHCTLRKERVLRLGFLPLSSPIHFNLWKRSSLQIYRLCDRQLRGTERPRTATTKPQLIFCTKQEYDSDDDDEQRLTHFSSKFFAAYANTSPRPQHTTERRFRGTRPLFSKRETCHQSRVRVKPFLQSVYQRKRNYHTTSKMFYYVHAKI